LDLFERQSLSEHLGDLRGHTLDELAHRACVCQIMEYRAVPGHKRRDVRRLDLAKRASPLDRPRGCRVQELRLYNNVTAEEHVLLRQIDGDIIRAVGATSIANLDTSGAEVEVQIMRHRDVWNDNSQRRQVLQFDAALTDTSLERRCRRGGQRAARAVGSTLEPSLERGEGRAQARVRRCVGARGCRPID
jgi:hypothetical protein